MRNEQTGMGSPFSPASNLGKRLKLFLWGDTGSGKTTLALQFPNPVVIDMEGGTDLYGDKYPFYVLRTTDADAAVKAVDWLASNDHDHKTVIIDPITAYWDALQKKYSDIFLNRNKAGRGFKFEFYDFQTRDWMTIKAEHKDFIRRLIRLDMNVVVTARQKTHFSDDGQMRKLGETFDGEKNLPYAFDTVVQLSRTPDNKYRARTIKDRSQLLPAEFATEYATFAELFGEASLERKAHVEAPVTEAQRDRIATLSGVLGLTEAQMAAGLSRRGFASMDELTESGANEVIASLTTKIEKEARSAKG